MKKLLILIAILMFSCQGKDIENLIVDGTVKNSVTGEYLQNLEVTIICWKYGNSPDQSYSEEEKVTITTNDKGKYSHTFDKGAYIEVKVNTPNFEGFHETKDIYSKKNTIDISLKPLN